jgi:hypothetical protein
MRMSDTLGELEEIFGMVWAQKPNCKTCANHGRIDGLSQETHCEHCIYQEKWRTDHYVRSEA